MANHTPAAGEGAAGGVSSGDRSARSLVRGIAVPVARSGTPPSPERGRSTATGRSVGGNGVGVGVDAHEDVDVHVGTAGGVGSVGSGVGVAWEGGTERADEGAAGGVDTLTATRLGLTTWAALVPAVPVVVLERRGD